MKVLLTLSWRSLATNCSDRKSGTKDGGVTVYVKKEIFVIRRSDLEVVLVEGLWLKILVLKSCSFLIATNYRVSNSSSYHVSLYPIFENILEIDELAQCKCY